MKPCIIIAINFVGNSSGTDHQKCHSYFTLQSPFFDGKQPNWYHFSCFFKQSKPQSVSEISGFGSLRWEDQQRIRDKLGGTDTVDGPSSSSTSKKRKTTRSDLQAEYAKSGRSTCKGCFSQIQKVFVQ